MEDSKFNLWRASFSFCFVDGFIDEAEEKWITDKITNLPFTTEQKKQLIIDLKAPPKISELLPLIKSPADRGFLVNNIRILAKLDKNLSPAEEEKIKIVTNAVLSKINLAEQNEIIRLDELASYHEDEVFKIDNKHSLIEAIVKNLQKSLNPGDYKFPDKK
jgi:hypothetical protein